MHKNFQIEFISRDTTDKAYPLIKATTPNLSLSEWRRFCDLCSPPNRSLRSSTKEWTIVAINQAAYVRGLSIYNVRDHAAYGLLLDVPFLVTAGALDAENAAAALILFIQDKCISFRCSGARLWTVNAKTWADRLDAETVAKSDHGIFMPAHIGAK